MALPQQLIYYTFDEYLELERANDARYEYIDGQLFLMAGESLAHSQISINIAGEVRAQLKGTPCQALSPNMKVRTQLHAKYRGRFSYPDLIIVCGTPLFHDKEKDVLTNPVVIFEVLSPSTERYDRGEKFLRFRAEIETLTDYVLIAQDMPLVEHYTRRSDGWLLVSIDALTGTLNLPNVNCRLSLAEVYDRVKFPEIKIDEPIENERES